MSRRRRRSRARENPSNLTWLLIGGGVVAAGAAIYFMAKPAAAATATAGATAPTPPQLNPAPQSVTVKVGDKINPPVLPTVPAGWSWQADPGYTNTSIAKTILMPQADGSFVAVGPGSMQVPFVATQHGPGPTYTGATRFEYNITVTA